MIKTEDIRLDLFKLEEKIIEKIDTNLTELIYVHELEDLLEGVKSAYEVVNSIVTDDIEDEELEEILWQAGAGKLDEYLPLLDEEAELNSLY